MSIAPSPLLSTLHRVHVDSCPVRIGLDARYLGMRPSGIGRATRELIGALLRLSPEYVKWIILTHSSFRGGWPGVGERLELHRAPQRPVSLWTLTGLGRWIRRQRLDLWHALFPLAPVRCPVPLVTTVHDLQPVFCPGWTGGRPWPLPGLYRVFYRLAYARTIDQSRAVAADSTATADLVHSWLPRVADKMEVVPLALSPEWLGPLAPDEPPTPDSPPYVLYVGSARPNKNITRMLRAFARVRRSLSPTSPLRFKLVIVPDRFLPSVRSEIRSLGLADCVDLLPVQDEPSLRRLYMGASALLFATTYEGFGLPPLEAMASGCPVVAARHGALPETCGQAALFVDPFDTDSIARGLERILTDHELREELRARGSAQVRRYSWDASARKMLEIYGRVLGKCFNS